jgi:hypothetical protein
MKSVGVAPVPNYTRDIKQGIARWDAFVFVPDPDALAAEYASRGVEFFESLETRMTDCAVLSSRTLTGIYYSSAALSNNRQGVSAKVENLLGIW